jgi:hypothetical protein
MKLDNAEPRLLTTDELESVAGGRKIGPDNDRALELLAATEKWLASVGVDTMGGFGQLR